MAAFRFRLAPVLRYRERRREEKQLELFTLEDAKARLAAEISKLETLLLAQAEAPRGQELSSADLRLLGDFAQKAARRIREQRGLLAAIQSKLEEKRAEVLQADTEVKSLEQLSSRLRERHRREANADEQKLTDEVGQRRYLDKLK
jgi:flagellar export protein FliJ